jgi:hypothetical protein
MLDANGTSDFPSIQPERIHVASGMCLPRPNHIGCARARIPYRKSIYQRSLLRVVLHPRETLYHPSAPSALSRRAPHLREEGTSEDVWGTKKRLSTMNP